MPSFSTPTPIMPVTNSSQSTKRRRTSTANAEETNPNPIIRSDIWFEDGSVILQAEFKQFRVHRSMLARHSIVFKDMFAMPQPQGEAAVEGCLIVHLPDSAEDIHHVLTALYDNNYNTRKALPFPAVAAMLRLGKKYEFEHLRDEALIRLTSEFPTKLTEWDKLPSTYTHIVDQKGLLFDIINLAVECGVQTIFPAAYYLCIHDLEALLCGQRRDDGTIAEVPISVQKACVLGRDSFSLAQSEHTLAWLDDEYVSGYCKTPNSCARACLKIIRNIWKPMPETSGGLEKWPNFDVFDLCQKCLEEAKDIHEEGRQNLWEYLPSFFDLPDWEHLKNFEM